MANKKIIRIPINMAVSTYTVRDTIQQGDVDAYRLEITLTDIDQIDGRAELRFEFPDGQYSDRETTVIGNTVIYEMQPEDYSQLGDLRCLVRLMDDHLFTPVLLIFTGIRDLVGNVEFEGEIQPYPQWVAEAQEIIDQFVQEKTYEEHNQPTADARWEISHGLGYYPSATVMDSAGTVILGDVRHIDENNLVIDFTHPESGKASLT